MHRDTHVTYMCVHTRTYTHVCVMSQYCLKALFMPSKFKIWYSKVLSEATLEHSQLKCTLISFLGEFKGIFIFHENLHTPKTSAHTKRRTNFSLLYLQNSERFPIFPSAHEHDQSSSVPVILLLHEENHSNHSNFIQTIQHFKCFLCFTVLSTCYLM